MEKAESPLIWSDVLTCNFCGGVGQAEYLNVDVAQPRRNDVPTAKRWYEGRPYRLVSCTDCDLVRVSPRPELYELFAGYMNAGPDAVEAVKHKRERKNVRDIHRRHIQTAMGYLSYKPERLFDMGCGAGTTLLEARALGLDAQGNEINRAAVDLLRSEGFSVQHGFTQDLTLPRAHFDIVLNFDYLEHTYTPKNDLDVCFDILKPNGILYLKTLYLGCPDHVAKGADWQLFGIGHFHFFTLEVLNAMIVASGFEIIEVRAGQLVFVAARKPANS